MAPQILLFHFIYVANSHQESSPDTWRSETNSEEGNNIHIDRILKKDKTVEGDEHLQTGEQKSNKVFKTSERRNWENVWFLFKVVTGLLSDNVWELLKASTGPNGWRFSTHRAAPLRPAEHDPADRMSSTRTHHEYILPMMPSALILYINITDHFQKQFQIWTQTTGSFLDLVYTHPNCHFWTVFTDVTMGACLKITSIQYWFSVFSRFSSRVSYTPETNCNNSTQSPEDSRFSGVLCQGTIETYSSSHLIPNDSNIFSVSSFHVTSSMKNTGRQHLTTCCSYF